MNVPTSAGFNPIKEREKQGGIGPVDGARVDDLAIQALIVVAPNRTEVPLGTADPEIPAAREIPLGMVFKTVKLVAHCQRKGRQANWMKT
ncbi:hypothetical protein [Paraburkholderia gardini]|uniref:hypothetical protein n=1 Tax=Paraburkholderia gardini TaxID=2823469 RepID=UPI001DA21317|nr:hypothetical protein [Paraburkholderia gardini]CAG4914062.1 hypothetical protein R69919_04161 [Paraburkholderia gardini]